MDERDERARLSEAVLRYLREHPMAMDTLEGIAEWWLMREQIRADVHTLGKVVEGLCRAGIVEEVGRGEMRRYRLKDRLDLGTDERQEERQGRR